MHDVAKQITKRNQNKSVGKKVVLTILFVLSLAVLIFGLLQRHVSVMAILVTVFAILAVFFGRLSFSRFRRGQTTSGAIWIVLCLFCVLFGIKFTQFNKMMSTPFTMPPATVASVPVKEVDWAPVLSSVGSISPVQGAIVSAELGGTVSEILFQNGGTAKKD